MSPWTVVDKMDPGLHDDVRGVTATLYELISGRPLWDDLYEQFQQLDPKQRAQTEKRCLHLGLYREDDAGPTVAVAEHRRYIGIKEVCQRCCSSQPCLSNAPISILLYILGKCQLYLQKSSSWAALVVNSRRLFSP